jgi:mono/diheme cytochrome c family protein
MKRLSLLIVSLGLGIARCDAASAQQSHSAHPNQSAASTAVPPISLGGFAPGGGTLVHGISKIGEEYAKSPEHIEAGKQLFQAMNCTGCHSNGGGGMGPALMGKTRIYGGSVVARLDDRRGTSQRHALVPLAFANGAGLGTRRLRQVVVRSSNGEIAVPNAYVP